MAGSMAEVGEIQRPAAAQSLAQRGPVQYLLVGAVAAVIVFVRLGATALEDHEAKAALAGRNIIRRDEWLLRGPDEPPVPPDTPFNRWLIPVNNGRPRLVKTPLPYWCIASLGLLAGQVDEWTARLPAAVSAVLCAWIALALGRRMFGPRAGLMGALMLAVTVGFQKWGRNARPEMMLCLFVTAAMACFYCGLTGKTRARRAGWMIAFWVAMGLANLAKQFLPLLLGLPLLAFVFWRAHDRAEQAGVVPAGSARSSLAIYLLATVAAMAVALAAVAAGIGGLWLRLGISDTVAGIAMKALLIALPLIWYAVRARPWRELAPLLAPAVPGIVIMLAAFLPWMWYMTRLFGSAGAVFSEQVAQRAAGTGLWREEGPQYYLLPLIMLTLPWAGFLPGALACPWMKRFRQHRHGLLYLFLWSAGLVALLTMSAGKREHYVLPMIPAVCLLMGFIAEEAFFRHRWIAPRQGRLLGMAYAAVGLAAPVAMAALWGVSALAADTIAARIAAADSPSPLLLALSDSRRWLHMLIVCAVAAAAALAALRAALREQLPSVLQWLVVVMVITYVGFHAGGPLWDDRLPAAEFARKAAQIVPPSAPVADVGDPQTKTVFYFGRNIPSIYLLAGQPRGPHKDASAHLAAFLAEPQYAAFTRDPKNVAWLLSYGKYAQQLLPLGYEVVLQVQGEQEKRTLFTLLRNTARRSAEPATTSP